MKLLRQITETVFKHKGETEQNWKDATTLANETTEELHQHLVKHYDFQDKMNTEEGINNHDVLKAYTKDSYNTNQHLWQSHEINDDPTMSPAHGDNVRKTDHALGSFKTPKAMTVYSGTKYDPQVRKDAKGEVHHPAYLSTSLKKRTAAAFGNTFSPSRECHVLAIHVPKGHPGAYVSHISNTPTEREFILPRGTKLKHLNTEQEASNHDGKLINIHHMKIVK